MRNRGSDAPSTGSVSSMIHRFIRASSLYLIDEDGFVLNQDGAYLLPDEVRQGRVFAELT
jgi:hypothetical protein